MIKKIRREIDKIIIRREGGQRTSKYARIKAQKNKVFIGQHSYGSCFSESFNVGGMVEIGRYCSFGPNVRYFGANHPIHYAAMTPYFYKKDWGYDVQDVPRQRLIIGNDVWIGYGVIITSSCRKIGNGAIVGAGSIVTKDIPAYAIALGVPAKITGYRFSEETQKALEDSQWWQLEPEELIKYYDLIMQPDIWAKSITESQKGNTDDK